MGAFEIDLKRVAIGKSDLEPLAHSSVERRVTFDGYLLEQQTDDEGLSTGYVQLFKSGELEIVDSRLVGGKEGNESVIYLEVVRERLIQKLMAYLSGLREAGVRPPLMLPLALLNVSGHRCKLPIEYFYGGADMLREPIGRRELIFPTLEIEGWLDEFQIRQSARPWLDALWNAANLSRCNSYDETGKWVGQNQ